MNYCQNISEENYDLLAKLINSKSYNRCCCCLVRCSNVESYVFPCGHTAHFSCLNHLFKSENLVCHICKKIELSDKCAMCGRNSNYNLVCNNVCKESFLANRLKE